MNVFASHSHSGLGPVDMSFVSRFNRFGFQLGTLLCRYVVGRLIQKQPDHPSMTNRSKSADTPFMRTAVDGPCSVIQGTHLQRRSSLWLVACWSLILYLTFWWCSASTIGRQQVSTTLPPRPLRSALDDPHAAALVKLQKQIAPVELRNFRDRLLADVVVNRTATKLYFDFGVSTGLDTKLYLSKGYSVVSVDAFAPWIDKVKKDHLTAYKTDHRLLALNVGVTDPSARDYRFDHMPLYFVTEGDVAASFVPEKGCRGFPVTAPECRHLDVPTVPCESILQFIGHGLDGDTSPLVRAEILKVDIEMMHHTCLRALQHVSSDLLPQYVCWEDHDKDFGSAKMKAPIIDVKLIILLYELGYDWIKLVMQGMESGPFYGHTDRQNVGYSKFSGNLHPEDMIHYRSYEDHDVSYEQEGRKGKPPFLVFDTRWRSVADVLMQGVFTPGRTMPGTNIPLAKRFDRARTYYDICMKLDIDATTAQRRAIRQHPENFPISRTDPGILSKFRFS
jgi:hypothetical protein